MSNGNKGIASILADAAQVQAVWQQNPTFNMGSVTSESLQTAINELADAQTVVENKRTELTGLVDVRDEKLAAVSDIVTRARSGIRAAYGSDSMQYDQVGGTRRSERKPPRRKAAANKPSA